MKKLMIIIAFSACGGAIIALPTTTAAATSTSTTTSLTTAPNTASTASYGTTIAQTSSKASTTATARSSTSKTTRTTTTSTVVSTTGLPSEFEFCDLDAGCADAGYALECAPLYFTLDDGGAFTQNECIETCSGTNDCANAAASCQYNVCYYDFCNTGASEYSKCNSAGVNDGQCYPEPIGGGKTLNFCFQDGVAPTGAPCDMTRGAALSLCVDGSTCITPMPDGGSFCYDVCDVTGILGCDAGECASLDIPGVGTGICVDVCNAGSPCPYTQVCTAAGFCAPKSMLVE